MADSLVGKRIKCTRLYNNFAGNGPEVGQCGKIIESRPGLYRLYCLVEFDNAFQGGHDGGQGQGKQGHCWVIPLECLKITDEQTQRKQLIQKCTFNDT